MTLDLGYAVASLIYVGFFALALGVQVSGRRYRPFASLVILAAMVLGILLVARRERRGAGAAAA